MTNLTLPHDHDGSPQAPDVVVLASSVEDVSAVLSYCNRHTIPVVPFGTGTGLEGGTNAVVGGVCLNVARNMASVLSVNEADFDCRVQSGVTWRDLNSHLRDTGLWFPVGSSCSPLEDSRD